MSDVVGLDGALLDEESISKSIITLSIPITANKGWNDISQMQNIVDGVYAFRFSGVYDMSKLWQNVGIYGGVFFWNPKLVCNTEEYSNVPFTYVAHATNDETLNFRIYMPSNREYGQFQIYTPFTNSSSQTGHMLLRKLL